MNTKKMIYFFGLLCCFNLYPIRCDENYIYVPIIDDFSLIINEYYVHKMEINSVELESIIGFLKKAFFETDNYSIEMTEIDKRMIRIKVSDKETLMADLTFRSNFLYAKSSVGMHTKADGRIYINSGYYQIFLGHKGDNKLCLMFIDRNDENFMYINYFYPNEQKMYRKYKYTNTEYFLEESELLEEKIIYKRRNFE
jgi:hypothetical protein